MNCPRPLLAVLPVVAACAASSESIAPPVAPPAQFSRSGPASLPDRWWTALADPSLDRLVEEALRSNLDLASAWYRLREARAIVERDSSPLWPSISAFADAEVRRPSVDDDANLLLGLAADYEIDLWGRLRSQADAARYRAHASLADYQTVLLSISAEVARSWYRLRETAGQIALLEEQLAANRDVLRLLESRFGSGQIRGADILRQRQLIEATRAQKLAEEARLGVLEHQLAVLLGKPPTGTVTGPVGVTAPAEVLPGLPPLPATGLPAELIRRRPDVRRAHALLLAADRELAAAISARYPRLSISASVGTAAGSSSELFRDWFAALAGNLLAPLFRGGELRAEVDRAEAVKMERLHTYGQIALEALREVEDALLQEHKQAERIERLAEQARLAAQTYEQLRIEYFNGMSDYIDVLTALTQEQALRRSLLTEKRALLELRIALYRALAGGFELAPPRAREIAPETER